MKIYLGLLVLIILAMVLVDHNKPKPINWSPSYIKKHKIPYGTYVLRNELPSLFPNIDVEDVKIAPYQFLENENRIGTYIFIDESISFAEAELNRMLAFVARGNTVFISTHGNNIDTLNLEENRLITSYKEETPFFKLINKKYKNTKFKFDRAFENTVFTKIDTLRTTVLGVTGYLDSNDEIIDKGINYIEYKHGSGRILLHTFPEVFTNYNMLTDKNYKHTAAILSFLSPNEIIYWDEYYKTGKARISSPMHYLLSSKSLKWAYYILLIGVLFFIVFEGKRKQRYIKVITPLKNQTLAFTRTISNMYYEKSEHYDIAIHKIEYLLEFIRLKLRVPTSEFNDNFYNQVAMKSQNTKDDVLALFSYCREIQNKRQITKAELLKLNSLIEAFKVNIQ